MQRRYRETDSSWVREEFERYQANRPCHTCGGHRLRPESLAVKIGGRHVGQVTEMSIREALDWVLANAASDPNLPGGVSYHFLMMLGTLCGGWQMARAATVAAAKLAGGATDTDFYNAKILSAKFFAEQALPRVAAHALSVQSGSSTMMSISLDQLRGD